jgi:SPP1 family predicted phage head-tail adaptor
MMNRRVTLLRRDIGKDAAGQSVESWESLPDVWADVLFETGAQVLRANLQANVKRASIRIRSRPDVDSTMRVRYLGEEYEIKGPPLPDSNDRRFMFLVCEGVK